MNISAQTFHSETLRHLNVSETEPLLLSEKSLLTLLDVLSVLVQSSNKVQVHVLTLMVLTHLKQFLALTPQAKKGKSPVSGQRAHNFRPGRQQNNKVLYLI